MSQPSPVTTILMLSANPQGISSERISSERISSQRLDREKRDIEEGLQRSRYREQFRLEPRSAVRPRDLQRSMLELKPQIVHFSGQGEAEVGLVFEEESGQPKLIETAALAELFALFAADLKCVVLNACYSETQAEAIAQHIPYVIGIRETIGEKAAIEFAVGFYDALGAGQEIEFAYKFGCSAARLSGLDKAALPILKQRSQPEATAEAKPVTIAPPTRAPANPAIYRLSTWVERSALTEPLRQVLQSQCRILVLTGITGIGKTALAERLVAQLPIESETQPRYCRLNLDEGSLTASFSSSGAALLRSIGTEPTLEDQKDPRNLLAHLLQELRSQPYRVQIDSMERLLQGDDQEGWSQFCDECWLELWQQLLTGADCQSQIILTTQELPEELEAIGSRYPQFWHFQQIRGLNAAEQMELFEKTLGRSVEQPIEQDYLQRIGRLYAGHPLVLRVIAEDIKACGANVQRYWQQGQFAELEAHRPAQLSRRKFQIEVKRRVKAALARLPEDALQLLCRSAVYRRPVPESFWFAMLPDRSPAQLQAAMNLLQSRSLAEEEWEAGVWWGNDGAIPLRQHNLIRGVAYELLKVDDAVWRSAERTAAEMWLNQYEAVAEAENLEQVRGSLEAFDHLCEIEAWLEAKAILFDQNIGLQLQTWGHYQEMILLYSRLGNHLSSADEVSRRKSLGNAYFFLSQYKQAIDFYQQSLELAREIGDRSGQWKALNNLGSVYRNLGNYPQSITYLEQTLVIAREIGDRRGEGNALGNLGNAYNSLGNYAEAIEFHQQNLAIAREIGDRRGEGNALGSLGLAYTNLGNYQQAIDFHQQYLTIAREIGDRQGEGYALGNLGVTFVKLEQYAEALENLELVLEMFKEMGNQAAEAETYKHLAELHQKTGELDQALDYCDRALGLAIELGIPLVKECEELKQQLEETTDG